MLTSQYSFRHLSFQPFEIGERTHKNAQSAHLQLRKYRNTSTKARISSHIM